MPRIRSARKRMRQAVTRTEQNRRQRAAVRTAVKKVRLAESPDAAVGALKEAERLLDRAAGKRLIHPNAAARLKSRLVKAVRARS